MNKLSTIYGLVIGGDSSALAALLRVPEFYAVVREGSISVIRCYGDAKSLDDLLGCGTLSISQDIRDLLAYSDLRKTVYCATKSCSELQ